VRRANRRRIPLTPIGRSTELQLQRKETRGKRREGNPQPLRGCTGPFFPLSSFLSPLPSRYARNRTDRCEIEQTPCAQLGHCVPCAWRTKKAGRNSPQMLTAWVSLPSKRGIHPWGYSCAGLARDHGREWVVRVQIRAQFVAGYTRHRLDLQHPFRRNLSTRHPPADRLLRQAQPGRHCALPANLPDRTFDCSCLHARQSTRLSCVLSTSETCDYLDYT
jgi:hypothetical protein